MAATIDRKVILTLLVAVAALAACGQRDSGPQATISSEPVTVLHGGTVLTVDEAFSVAESIAVQGNRILAVGTHDAVIAAAGEGAELIDVAGKTVLPAFIDPHFHALETSSLSYFESVGQKRFRSVEDALAHMASVAAVADEGDWLLFTDIDLVTQESDTDEITADMLDEISSELPIVLVHAGGHMASVNTRMLDIMGLTSDSPDPPGAPYGRNPDGSLNGMLLGSAVFGLLGAIEPLKSWDPLSAVPAYAAKNWLPKGLGTLGLPGIGGVTSGADDWKLVQALAADPAFPIRTRAYLIINQEQAWIDAGTEPGEGDEMARVIGYKLSADGSNQIRTGLQREPYMDTDENGLAYLTAEQVVDAVARFSRQGFQVAMHGNGDAAIDNIIAAVAAARAEGIDVVRPRIEHCSIVQDDQLQDLIDNGISCSFLIGHVRYWGAAFRDKVFGLDKTENLDRAGSFDRAGIPFSLHSDSPVTDVSPLEMVEIAVTRTLFREPDYVLAPDERVTVETALRSVTSVPAWQLLSEDEIGSLEAGKLADLVILDSDPRLVAPDAIEEIIVLETWIDGERVF